MATSRPNLALTMRTVLISLLFILSMCTVLVAQPNHTSYFMRNSPIATRLNPAIQPDRGFVTIPGIGSTGISYVSNGLALQDIFHLKGNKVVTFMDESVDAEAFLSGLKASNSLTIDNTLDIVNVGWFSNRASFWGAGLNVKSTIGARVPIALLDFMKRGIGVGTDSYKISDFTIDARSYIEGSVSYSRQITRNITVGARLKVIGGLGNVHMQVDDISATHGNGVWAMKTRARISASVQGSSGKLSTDGDGTEYISGFDYDKFGMSGWGGGIDLGVTYMPLKNLVVSVSVLDLGLIVWDKKAMIAGEVDGEYTFDGFNPNDPNSSAGNQISDLGDNLMKMVHVSEVLPYTKTTSLHTTINIGGEYSILDNQLGFGLLSSTKFYPSRTYSELTVSVNGRPCDWFSGSLSYSFVYSQFKTLGLALNFHPGFINFFVGSDYMFFSAKRGVPQFSKATSFHIGMSIPLGRKPHISRGYSGI